MTLPPQKIHLSFSPGPWRMAMGLIACDPDEAFEIDDQYPAELAQRRALLDSNRDAVFAALPGSDAARHATLARVADILPRRHPALFSKTGDVLHNRITGESWNLANPERDPLDIAGRLVQDDLCLMQPSPDGPVLVAANLCFPSRWSLAAKLGKPMAQIHAPVPHYAEKLARPVDRFFAALAPGKLVQRLNWSLSDDPTLHQPANTHNRREANPDITPVNAGEKVHLRVERQTLSRIGEDGTILFTIRVHSYKLNRVAASPAIAADLISAIDALPHDVALYKSFFPYLDPLMVWLSARATAR